jgi:hypothetical protein
MSHFIERLVKTLLYAATFLLLTRIASIWLSFLMHDIPFTLEARNDITLLTVESSSALALTMKTANNIFVALVVLVSGFVLTKSLIFNDLTRSPRVLVKVIHYNLTGWLEDGKELYPKLFGWNILLWIVTIVVIKDAYNGLSSTFLPIILTLFSMYFTYKVLSFLDKHISDMIGYIYAQKH